MIGKPIYGKGFKGLAAYLAQGALPTKERAKDERIVEERRVAWSYSRNLAGLDPETDWKLATRTMKATAAMSSRTEKPVLHLPLAWPAADTDRLTPEAMRYVADRLLEEIGLGEHQAMVIAHDDTEHKHLHLVINRVHPVTGKAWSTSRDWERINLSLAKMEKEFEFTPVDHWGIEKGMERELAREKDRRKRREPEIGEKQRALREKDKPLIPFGVEDRAPKIRELSALVRGATSWQGLDKALSEAGFSMRVKGQGLILTDGSHYLKLSQLGKDIRLERLEERFDQAFESFDLEKARALEKDRRVRMPTAPETPNTDGMTPYDRKRALEMYEKQKEVFEARARRIGMTDDPISDLDIADGELRMWIDAEATHKGARRRMRQLEREEFGLVAKSDRSCEGLERKKDRFSEAMGKVFTDPLAAAERWGRIEKARGRDEAEKLMMQQPAAFGDLKGWNLSGLKTPERKQAERAWRKLIERRRAYQFAIHEQEAYWNLLRDTRSRLTAARQRYEMLTFRDNALEPLPQIITSLIRKRMVALERVTEEMIWKSNLASDRKEQLEAALRRHKEKKRDLARSRELERETGVYRDFFRAKKPEKHLELGKRRDRDRERDIDE